MVALAEIIRALEADYDPRWAANWDAVGLVCGDPEAPVTKILFAVDPVTATVEEAVTWGAGLLVTHHPLFLAGVHGVPATDPKGRLVHRLIGAGCALYVAHTNADVARPGVSDALAEAIGLVDVRPLAPDPTERWLKVIVFVPHGHVDQVTDAMAAAGAGAYGAYDRCAWSSDGEGTFRPAVGANPTLGTVGEIERVAEARVEMVLPEPARAAVVAALRSAHPYEEPAFDVVRVEGSVPPRRGLGRTGRLDPPEPFPAFVARVARALPATRWGVRAAGPEKLVVESVAVCGGAGGSETELARAAGADAYVTADQRHHHASEALERGLVPGARAMGLVDVAHWASEWPWLPAAAARLRERLGPDAADTVELRVSTTVTDPWTTRADQHHGPPSEGSRT